MSTTAHLIALLASALTRITVAPAPHADALLPLVEHVGGRMAHAPGDPKALFRQWPGSYFETAFDGQAVLFRIGAGEVRLHILVDGAQVSTLAKPLPGMYRIAGLAPGRHVLRVEVASESQTQPTMFGGFFAEAGTRTSPLVNRTRAIEFIGDSHTVGYGNTSIKTDCTQDEVWKTTDTSKAFGPVLARKYGADYEVNAISGRGVVRNYNGFEADKLPEAYPFTLFDKRTLADEPGWQPQVIVIALGTNDFTTPLHLGERWATRDVLHADFEKAYIHFVQRLRARNRNALIVIWATDMAKGEIETEAAKVTATLRASGDTLVDYVTVNGLSFTGCHAHPSLDDEAVIAGKIAAAIDAHGDVWSVDRAQRTN
jgi:lysophospholipase L1-like esterase